jgi:cytochrome c peroxidase
MVDQAAYDIVREEIKKVLVVDDWDDGHIGPILVRLAFHVSGTYDKNTKTGGSNGGWMRFNTEGGYGHNKGLEAARRFLEPIKVKFPWISYSDLWTLGAVVALEELAMPGFEFKIFWLGGRIDKTEETSPPDNLPGPQLNAEQIRATFNRMGFMDDEEIVLLIGAHSLGKAHPEFSGQDGAWTRQPRVFANQFYSVLDKYFKENKWKVREWSGPTQYFARDTLAGTTDTKTLLMLPTDIALVKDENFRKFVEKYAPFIPEINQLFYTNFAKAFSKLLGFGVPGYPDNDQSPDK